MEEKLVDVPLLQNLALVDTPGTNAVIQRHSQIEREGRREGGREGGRERGKSFEYVSAAEPDTHLLAASFTYPFLPPSPPPSFLLSSPTASLLGRTLSSSSPP